ncbi:MAG: hypothetical protein QM750_24935 [Rubrivivax sp.]
MVESSIIELRCGKARARIAPALGGRITACSLVGSDGQVREVLHPYPESHHDLTRWAKGGIYPLLPYSGRIADAQLQHAGRSYSLVAHPAARPHTLHGPAHRRAWSVQGGSEDEVRLRLQVPADEDWPWPLSARLSVRLAEHRLRLEVELMNPGSEPMPAGIGCHPYIASAAFTTLQFTAAREWFLALDGRTQGHGTVASPRFDVPTAVGDQGFTRLFAGWAGTVTLECGASRLTVTASRNLDHLVVHRLPGGPFTCIEPVSHVSDAFNLAARGFSGTGTRYLEPGEQMHGWMALASD